MIKILIPKNNIFWDTNNISNKNVIDFPGESKDESFKKRDEFINYVIFNDQFDFKNLDNGYWIEKDLIINNTYQAKLKLNINDYLLEEDLNQKKERISNLNYIIINQNNLFKFYFVSKIEWLNKEEFIIIINLDIYTTYPISTILNGYTMIERVHLERNNLNNLSTREDFNLNLSKIEEIKTNFRYGNDVINNSIIWIIGIYKSESPQSKMYQLPLNYDFYLYPINKFSNNTIINDVNVKDTFINDLKEVNFVSFHILESPLYPDKFAINKNETDNLVISIIEEDGFIISKSGKFFVSKFYSNKEMAKTEPIDIHNFLITANSYMDDKNIIFEHKLFLAPFQYYVIETTNGNNSIQYDPIYIKSPYPEKYPLSLKFTFSLNPSTHNSNIYLESMPNSNFSSTCNINPYAVISDNEYPQKTTSFNEILEKSKSNQRTAFLSDFIETGSGIGEMIFGSISKNYKLFLKGTKDFEEGIFNLANDLVENRLNNLKENSIIFNSPKSSGDFFTSYLNGEANYSWKLNKYSLNKNEEISLWDYFYQYGYRLDQIKNIENYLDSRYWFNFIKSSGVFYTIDKKLTNEIKLNLNKDFMNGITFWHYRNKDTWNGIKHYDKENLEISYI
ncbi:MAG: hypothetical protein HPPSJP_5000 [Candidatus Hepatoplasma scabrum]|nr:MAG: hypothetical protein HPPSJP_5000 [Candidatus Hepatoplasma sp.]